MNFESFKSIVPQEKIADDKPQTIEDILNISDMDAELKEKLTSALASLNEKHKHEVDALTDRLEHFESVSLTDELTGAANYRGIRRELKRIHSEQSRENIPIDYSLVFFDLNNFKTINDTLGHRAGDDTLIEVVRSLDNTIRPSDTIFRKGGDEFLVLLPKTDEAQAAVVAQRILDAILVRTNTALQKKYTSFPGVSASLGVASYAEVENDDPSLTDESFMDILDTLMYTAKGHKKIDPLGGKIVKYSEKAHPQKKGTAIPHHTSHSKTPNISEVHSFA